MLDASQLVTDEMNRKDGGQVSRGVKNGREYVERKGHCSGLKIARVFSTQGVSPFDQVEWERRKASITDDKGNTIFEQEGVEVPKF